MEEEIEFLFKGDIQRLALHPDDIVVLKFATRLRPEQVQHIQELMRAKVPQSNQVLILDANADVGVICPTENSDVPCTR